MENERGYSRRHTRAKVNTYASMSMRNASFIVFDVQFKLIPKLPWQPRRMVWWKLWWNDPNSPWRVSTLHKWKIGLWLTAKRVPPLRTILFLISSDLPSLAVLPLPKGSSSVLFNVCVTSRSKTQIFSGGTNLECPGQESVVLPLSMLGVDVVEVQIPKQLLRREADKLCSWAVSGSRSRRPGLSSLLFFSLQ